MNKDLQNISDFIQKSAKLTQEEKNVLSKAVRDVDSEIEIISFKLQRTEKVKKTTAILLEETIEELEKKRADVEEANEALKASLEELKAAQTQLIHSEKMASLGELTAGIAHEIQNPLNFVNNFADVSIDLIEELQAETCSPPAGQAGLKAGRDLDLEKEILGDIVENLKKISHHGQRASSIVKGMLEHSRSGDGKKELTDINVLSDEYLRLAYHGLRAKDKSFNAEFHTELDESLPKIPVVPQDIGRVLLNLINNAFYAVSSKAKNSKEGIDAYKPRVVVKTRKADRNVEISVKDNADGIADDVVDKIFQPFFTTKPTGQGTGLGLSLSYASFLAEGEGSVLLATDNETIRLVSRV